MGELASPTLTTHAWCRATGGALDRGERRAVLAAIVRDYPRLVGDVVRLVAGGGGHRRPAMTLPTIADEVVDAVLAATARQGPSLERHGLRTWLLGALLARQDGVEVDPDELFVAAVAHDVGLTEAVSGEDFTLRSAAAAVAAWTAAHGEPAPDRAQRLRDAVVAHLTPGLEPRDTHLGWAVQAGAVADLLGLRLPDLPTAVVDEVYRRHPQRGMRRVLAAAVRAEAAAVPAGRFAVLRQAGFVQAVLLAPHRGR